MWFIFRSVLAVMVAVVAVPSSATSWALGGGSPDPGPAATDILFVNFDDPLPGGYTFTGNLATVSGSAAGVYEAPEGDTSTFGYFSPVVGTGTAELHTIDQTNISFYWGSIEADNAVDVLGFGDQTLLTISGADLLQNIADQDRGAYSQRINIFADDDIYITGLRFRTTNSAFEIDDISGQFFTISSDSGVPEFATWALMICGFGSVGVTFRERRRRDVMFQPSVEEAI